MFIKKFISSLCVLFLFACSKAPDKAQLLAEDCFNHYKAESFKVALQVCRQAADLGNAYSMMLLGDIYYYDLAAQGKDAKQAFNWYLQAAEQGMVGAQTLVGESYLFADGVEEDFDEAYQWFKKAAAQDDSDAQYALGRMFSAGKGRPKDISVALSWHKKSAASGHVDSINSLAWIYATTANKSLRNAKKAVYWAEKLTPHADSNHMLLDTQAAAYALAEDFQRAIKLQQQAVEHIPEDAEQQLVEELNLRLQAYQNGEAWIETESE